MKIHSLKSQCGSLPCGCCYDTPLCVRETRCLNFIPNRYWYQLNGQSAQANWLEQREAIYSRIQEQEEEAVPQIIFTSEVKIR